MLSLLFFMLCIFRVSSYLEKPGVVTYWGQNSKSGSDSQKSLSAYCDASSDVVIISFLLNFKDGSLPTLNLANSCTGPTFDGTSLLQCTDIGKDIQDCQKKGKVILLSLGGDSGAYGFSNDKGAQDFADTLWNSFGAGKSKTRPFGDAVVDGFDLDIEGGGPNGYPALMKRLRSHFSKDHSKEYYITGSPQCPYPDAMLEEALNEGEFDAVHVQFYNNYCSTTSNNFNFESWDKWAKKTSRNKNVKILLGLPGSDKAANSGYVPFKEVEPIVKKLHSTYSSFGGVMIWDASASYGNKDVSPNYQAAIAKLIHGLSGGKLPSTNKHSTGTKTMHNTRKSTTATSTAHHTKAQQHTTTKTFHATMKATTTTKHRTKAKPTTFNPPTSTPSKIKEGQSCSTSATNVCSGTSFATCSNGKWVLFACPSGLTCLSNTAVYCGHKNKRKRSFENSRITAQFSFISTDQHRFTAQIYAQRNDDAAFSNSIMLQFKVPHNMRLTHVENGRITNQKNHLVKIHYMGNSSMNALVRLEGHIIPSNPVLIAPNINTFKFSS